MPLFSALLLAVSLSLGAGPGLVSGIYSSDLLLLSVTGLGVASAAESRNWQLVMGIIGGVVLCAMGAHMMLKKTRTPEMQPQTTKVRHFVTLFFKGALVNVTNPTILLYWFTLAGVTIGAYGYLTDDYYIFFITLFASSIALDLLKVWAVSRWHGFWGLRTQNLANRFLGAALVGIGIFFCVRAAIR